MPKRILPLRKPGRRPRGDATAPETREHLMHVARELVAQRGIADLSLREIAQRANVNPALLNYYFGNLQDLQGEMLTQALDRLDDALARIEGDVAQFLTEMGDAIWARPELARFLLTELFHGKDASQRTKRTRTRLRSACLVVFGCAEGEVEDIMAFALAVLCAPHLSEAGPRTQKSRRQVETIALALLQALKR